MTPRDFACMFGVLHNLSKWELEEAGVINPGANGGTDWTRFNNNLTTFVLKLSEERIERLLALLTTKMGEA